MNTKVLTIIDIQPVTHNVRRYKLNRPIGVIFIPGQAAHLSINKPSWINEIRPFTFTGLTDWDHLEFTIKSYNDHDGVTQQIGKLNVGDEFVLHDIFGTIQYQDVGTFIAGGAGVTPFIAILRDLSRKNKLSGNRLIFSNRTEGDIILFDEFTQLLKNDFINVVTHDETSPFYHKKIDPQFLKEHVSNFSGYFYVCGPDAMIDNIQSQLLSLGVAPEKIIREIF